MSEIEFTGKHGWGVLPDVREKDRPPREVQLTLYSIQDLTVPPVHDAHLPPIAKRQRKESRSGSRFTQGRFEYSDLLDSSFTKITSPYGDIHDRRVYDFSSQTTEVDLPDGRQIAVPEDFQGLRKFYPMSCLNTELAFFVPEQARGLILAREIKQNLFLRAPTSFGKTFLEILIAAGELDDEKAVVLILTPTVDVAKQIYDQARLFLKLKDDQAALLSGQVPGPQRAKVYENSRLRLLIALPNVFANDIEERFDADNRFIPRKVDPTRFTAALLDEGDLGVGETGYLKAGKALAEAGVRLIALSATEPDKEFRRHEMLGGFAIDRDSIFHLHAPPKRLFRKTTFHQLENAEILEAGTILYNKAGACAENLWRNLSEAVKFGEGRIVKEEGILKLFEKATKLKKGGFEIPSMEESTLIRQGLAVANREDQSRFGASFSLVSEFGYRCYLYHALTRFGKLAAIAFYASDLFAYRFNAPRKKGKAAGKYFQRVFKDEEIKDVFAGLAKGTLFEHIFKPSATLTSIARAAGFETWGGRSAKIKSELEKKKGATYKPVEWWSKKYRAYCVQLRDAFLKVAMQDIASSGNWYDGPVLERVKDLVLRHCTFGAADQVIVATDSAENAIFYPMVLNRLIAASGRNSVPFAGVMHLDIAERQKNLEVFKNNEAAVIVGTNGAIKVGLHSSATVLIVCNQEVTVSGQEQLEGRVGRIMMELLEARLAYIYYEIMKGTADYIRYNAGYHRRKESERLARKEHL